MKKRMSKLLLFIFFTIGIFTTLALSAGVPRITKEELKVLLGKPDLIIIDVRTGSDWSGSDLKIQAAVREDPQAISSWANKYPKDKTFVVY